MQVAAGTGILQVNIVDWGVRPVPWEPLLEPQFLEAMQTAERMLQERFQQKARSRTVYLRAREFHLAIAPYELWFDLRSPMEEQMERYRLFLEHAGAEAARSYVDL